MFLFYILPDHLWSILHSLKCPTTSYSKFLFCSLFWYFFPDHLWSILHSLKCPTTLSSSPLDHKLLNVDAIPLDIWLNNPQFLYIGRLHKRTGQKSKWGNPFSVSIYGRLEAIRRYEHYVRSSSYLMHCIHEIKNKTLLCHCTPLLCHGTVLLKLAYQE